MKVISLGSTCQPAYWIRKFLDQPEAYFFDWLITPPVALKKVLSEGVDGLLIEKNLSIHARKIRVVDDIYQLQFQHDFPADENGFILNGYEKNTRAVKEKYSRRYQRLINNKNSADTVFIRYGDHYNVIVNLIPILKKYLGENHTYIFISNHITKQEVLDDCHLFPSNLTDDWKGDELAWDKLMQFIMNKDFQKNKLL